MKIHMVVLYLYLLIIGANGEAKKKSGGRLTPEENKQRLETCGTTAIDTPSRDNKAMELEKWPNWVSFAVTADQRGAGAALTTMISPRHFLTSSQVVMDDSSYTWRYNSKRVGNCRQMPQGKLEVPKEALEKLLFFKSGCLPNCNRQSLIPVTRAVILKYCHIEPEMWWWSQAVMVIEIAEDIGVDGGFPCLAYGTQQNGTQLDVYSHLWKGRNNQSIFHRKLELLNTDGMSYKFLRYNEDGERGSPVMKQDQNGKWNLVGLGAQQISDSETGVLRMSWIGWQLCREVGVCRDTPPPPPPPKPTDPPKVETTTTPTTTMKAEPKKTEKPEPPPVKEVPITVRPITPATKPKPTVAAGKLTKKENLRRLLTCGKTPIETPSGNNISVEITKRADWAWGARTKGQNDTGTALTTMISTRHFLTSSQVVITDEKKWVWNSQKVEKCDGPGQVHLEVPKDALGKLQFRGNLLSRAVILDYCKMDEKMWNMAQGVMIVELAKDVEDGFPCLADTSTDGVYTKGKELDVYTMFIKSDKLLRHRKLTLGGNHANFLVFDRYHEDGDRGGQIMDNVNGRWTLVGLGAGGASKKSAAFRISSLQEQLCEVVGVCHSEPIPVPRPTIAATTSKTPEAPPPLPTPPPEQSPEAPPPPVAPPARRREDEETDEDYEMFLKRKKEKEEAEMYENEDTDILISKDDINGNDRCGGGGFEKWIIVLCLFVFFV
ncbi:hypothetical protein GCK72_003344 [Caenorhabditis remanei]|uniref:Uncharacterized protein n=1 Tax=Caenorhabditis remanei TaxID=31234 RepID=A0A6A5HY19_CAERE|nr:hypothetical protein GCK72_003344 [Caenorhabditis remanei]KAF1771517.1 hypothetical protein GCK72_003344 [Caenorhabditis remanei]